MITDELALIIRETFGMHPTAEQELAIQTFCQFITCRAPQPVMIMRGCAGTGKTSLASAFVRTMKQLQQIVALMAPTGRAAKVFALNSGHEAYTIHRRIYRQKSGEGSMGSFSLDYNKEQDALFVVDESSMIANDGQGQSIFGTGRLLDDLIQFVYSGRNCRLLLIGDKAQLPPVGEEQSPALQADVLKGYGLDVFECDLNEVLRQAQDSGILYNATLIRQQTTSGRLIQLPRIQFNLFADISNVPGNELIETLENSYREVGKDETMVVTRSNKRANAYNIGIRNTILGREEELTTGDMLLIVKNNYFWGNEEREKKKAFSFIANGDRAYVQRVRNIRELYGFRFADVWLTFPDYHDVELQTTVVLDSLHTEAPALTREQDEQLFNAVMEDYADIRSKSERLKKIKEDPYYNALQVKYAYAVTCHKAQGGQWAHVYIDQGYMTEEMLMPDYIHWLYTAFTRATERLFLVNWPEKQTEV